MSGKNIYERERYISIKLECDVLVAGGGTAGVVAALAAARNGVKTVLIEHHGSLGGAMINGATALHSFFNIFRAFPGVEKVCLERWNAHQFSTIQEAYDAAAAGIENPTVLVLPDAKHTLPLVEYDY